MLILAKLMVLACITHYGMHSVEASHFYGGSMSATVIADLGTSVTIQFRNNFAYKRVNTSFSAITTWCNDTTIQTRAQFGVSEVIECVKNCFTLYEIVGNTEVYCESYSESENWSYGINTFVYSAPKSNNYQVSYYSGNWGQLAAYGAGAKTQHWELRMRQNLSNRSDTNIINTTPVTLAAPFISLPQNIVYDLKIPFIDVDNDNIRCKFGLLFQKARIFNSILIYCL
jgi:hypothetical protein